MFAGQPLYGKDVFIAKLMGLLRIHRIAQLGSPANVSGPEPPRYYLESASGRYVCCQCVITGLEEHLQLLFVSHVRAFKKRTRTYKGFFETLLGMENIPKKLVRRRIYA